MNSEDIKINDFEKFKINFPEVAKLLMNPELISSHQ